MKYLISILVVLAIPVTVINRAYSGEVTIVDVEVSCTKDCMFSVTLQHADEGWEHYANQWDVVTLDGKLIKSRVLIHPHVDEQPFTRSLSGVKIPQGMKAVKIRAKDTIHGYARQEYIVELNSE
ncbi:MAG: hypothetical protein ACC663_08240 [Gammaproteobacteria bacterium]